MGQREPPRAHLPPCSRGSRPLTPTLPARAKLVAPP
ncbi:hypothetical protein NK6_9472 [Bradyrhizobium diazoefficiens]|uniref:Uncharacterized protein n=1 Tax=Bradyrhizobium diazoefficiens TaxID=1355477 RepID=A0A0E4BXH9_9BRAD|nr:hypothetical protein NK6_9472 [Bradyrhizobium diazoefficiens]